MKTIVRLTIAAAVVFSATAANAHWDRPSCYIEVHNGCYVDTTQPCTDEEYQGFLENCDTAYPHGRGSRPGGLTVKPGISGLTSR